MKRINVEICENYLKDLHKMMEIPCADKTESDRTTIYSLKCAIAMSALAQYPYGNKDADYVDNEVLALFVELTGSIDKALSRGDLQKSLDLERQRSYLSVNAFQKEADRLERSR